MNSQIKPKFFNFKFPLSLAFIAVCCFAVGMMIELMAGKSAAELGICHNASPFTYANGDEDDDCDAKTAVEVFQDYLIKGLLILHSDFAHV